MARFKEIAPEELVEAPFKLIWKDWMLVTAGGIDSFNTMTANWGGLGELWFKRVCYVVVRPSRYTYEFMERGDVFTLTFFDQKYRDALNICGAKSGRDIDKVKETGLTPVASEAGGVYFDEARIVLECKKIYFQDINPSNFLDDSIKEGYPDSDYHRLYIGEILRCMVREQ